MNKMRVIVITIILIIFVSLCSYWLIYTFHNPFQRQQENLAKEFGVRIDDYPFAEAFPEGYFYTILTTEMTINDVHEIVRGYELVYRCKYYSEIYYYYSSDDDKALRFEILYDDQGFIREFRGEDDDSRTIRVDSCEPGLIGVNK